MNERNLIAKENLTSEWKLGMGGINNEGLKYKISVIRRVNAPHQFNRGP